MNRTSRYVILVACAALGASAAEIQPGDTLAEVRATLGAPRGRAVQDGRQVLYYQQGEVELQGDTVTRVALRTAEEQAALEAREEKSRAERTARREQLVAEGTALRDRKLADPDFKDAPFAYQVTFWEDLARRYPGVSVVEPLTIARMQLNEQLEKNRREAEAVARAAEREEFLAAQERVTEVYPLFTGLRYPRYRHYYPPSLGPISYDFWATPLPPYSTPSGNPAGNLSGPVVNLPSFNPAQPPRIDGRRDRDDRWDDGDASRRSHRRGFDRDWRQGL